MKPKTMKDPALARAEASAVFVADLSPAALPLAVGVSLDIRLGKEGPPVQREGWAVPARPGASR
jgi:hypothetical protein